MEGPKFEIPIPDNDNFIQKKLADKELMRQEAEKNREQAERIKRIERTTKFSEKLRTLQSQIRGLIGEGYPADDLNHVYEEIIGDSDASMTTFTRKHNQSHLYDAVANLFESILNENLGPAQEADNDSRLNLIRGLLKNYKLKAKHTADILPFPKHDSFIPNEE